MLFDAYREAAPLEIANGCPERATISLAVASLLVRAESGMRT